ncbi:MAG TPA: hypothetical protein VFB62_09830, partial [Polyangiaceae bacterium]|nr:hypothetical protein [Polyangiaceae bacterium]
MRLTAWALQREDWIGAITAALDGVVLADPKQDDRETVLTRLLENVALVEGLGKYAVDDQPFAAGIVAAARTRSSMGRADAFVKLGDRFHGAMRGLLLALAAEAYASAGSAERARKTALSACAVAGWLPRAHGALLSLEEDHELDVAQLENALAQFPARARNYLRIAERLRAEGRHTLALAWARRASDLRRGDREPLEALLGIAVDSQDVALSASTVAHVLAAAQPHSELADALRRTLESVAEQDLKAALEIGRMVLSAIGPGREPLYLTLRHLATRAGDHVFEVALVLRRAVGDEIEDAARAELYLEATELCLPLGDAEAAAEHCYCAAAHAGPLERLRGMIERVRTAVDRLAPEQRSDALLALAHANAWAAEQQDTQTAVEAWRELAALRSDVADDHEGAEEAFFVACAHDPEAGPYRYAGDLTDRFGAEAAVSILVDRAVSIGDEGDDPKLCAKLYAAAARVAADHDLVELAINAAVTAVQVDPSRGDAVAVVEKIADGDEGLAALNFIYNTLADTALGRYGYRAAHYRAARQFEKRNAYDHALRHAIMAFEAVPSVGASYQMLLRLAERAGDEGAAVRTLAGVAASFPTDVAFMWMMRAADLAKSFAAGRELTFELLLKAFKLRQSPELAQQLGDAARALAEDLGDEEIVHVRLERALRTALPHLGGARGAQTAVSLGVLAADILRAPRLAVDSLLKAIEIDGPETDCSAVVSCMDAIAVDRDAARELLTHINELRANSKAPLDHSLKEITAQLYLKLSDVPPPPSSRAPAPSGAPGQSDRPSGGPPRISISSFPPASSTMDSAQPAETPVPPPPLDEPELARLDEPVAAKAPPEKEPQKEEPPKEPEAAKEPQPAKEPERAQPRAEEAEEPEDVPLPLTRRGELPLPLTRRTPVADEPEVTTSQEELELDEAILNEEEQLAREAAAKPSEVEILGERDADYEIVTEPPSSGGVEVVSERSRDVEIITNRPEPITRPPSTPAAPSKEDARDAARLRRALDANLPMDTAHGNASPTPLPIVERRKEPRPPDEVVEHAARSREAAWRAAAEVRGKTDRPTAAAHDIDDDEDWTAIDYSPASEQSARERGDHAAIARMLAARALATENLEQRRLVRLRRAAVLEQRLDLLDEACAELEAILEECGEDATALRYLADLCDRMERPTRAARLWLRASKQAASLDEKLRDVARCCEALLTAERPETAKRLMDAAAGLPQSPRMLKLRIEVARMLDDEQELAHAEAELSALDEDVEPTTPPSDSLHPFDSAPPTRPPPSSAPRPGDSQGPHSVSSRRVFRVGGAIIGGHSPASVLMSCRNAYTERGVGGPRDAKETVRKLRAIADDLPEGDRDLHTFLLVEALDAMQGSAAAMKELQRHWETIGGTPLVTLAVADRLVRRGDLRPALRLYERVMDKELRDVRTAGRVALSAAEVAHRLRNDRTAETYLERAALDPDSREAAEQRFAKWFGRYSARPWAESAPPSGTRPTTSPPPSQPASGPAGLRQVPTEDALGELEIDDRGEVAEPPEPSVPERIRIPSSPPQTSGSLLRRAPTFPELVAPQEEELFNELIDGSYDAGEALVAQFLRD